MQLVSLLHTLWRSWSIIFFFLMRPSFPYVERWVLRIISIIVQKIKDLLINFLFMMKKIGIWYVISTSRIMELTFTGCGGMVGWGPAYLLCSCCSQAGRNPLCTTKYCEWSFHFSLSNQNFLHISHLLHAHCMPRSSLT